MKHFTVHITINFQLTSLKEISNLQMKNKTIYINET